MSRTITILSIDGGGMRGIIPATLLTEIEKRTGKPISTLFDLIAGTSTGGILTLGMVKPDQHGLPAYTAQQGLGLYEREGGRIFASDVWHRLQSLGNTAEEKYPSEGIETVLDQFFGETRLKDALTDVLVTSYDIERRMATFFKSRKARTDPAYDFPMKRVARATSAAPTFFEPLRLEALTPDEYYPLVDGGVHSNNPAMCALAEAMAAHKDADDYFVVSIGTGQLTHPIPYDKAKNWGLIGWVKPLIEIMFDGMVNTVDYELRQFLPDREGVRRYYRFQPMLTEQTATIDDARQNTLRLLKLTAEDLVRNREQDVAAMCQRLSELADLKIKRR
jgi:patatin-like phospholipase/acyl hydrolase